MKHSEEKEEIREMQKMIEATTAGGIQARFVGFDILDQVLLSYENITGDKEGARKVFNFAHGMKDTHDDFYAEDDLFNEAWVDKDDGVHVYIGHLDGALRDGTVMYRVRYHLDALKRVYFLQVECGGFKARIGRAEVKK